MMTYLKSGETSRRAQETILKAAARSKRFPLHCIADESDDDDGSDDDDDDGDYETDSPAFWRWSEGVS